MKTVSELRQTNLANIISDLGSLRALSEITEISSSQISQWLNGSKSSATGKERRISHDSCRRIESCCGKPAGWMDADHSNQNLPRDIHTEDPVLMRAGLLSRLNKRLQSLPDQKLQALAALLDVAA